MAARIELEPVFVLLQRPYRNTSCIVELFAKTQGRVAAIARSARGPKSRYRGMLQPFTPLLASWIEHQELATLSAVEPAQSIYSLEGEALFCGFYLNELLMRLLSRHDPYPRLFTLYESTLTGLKDNTKRERTLRIFEKHLLHLLGYGVPFYHDAISGSRLQPEQWYQYIPEQGFVACAWSEQAIHLFSGGSLLALQQETLTEAQHLKDAKRLMRMVLARYLGPKPLKSRELYV